MTERKRWNPIPSILYGVSFGVVAGGLMILATGLGDDWRYQGATVLEITIMTTLACAAVSYARQFISN
jgi:hypothetical protein